MRTLLHIAFGSCALLHAQDELAYRSFSNAPGLQPVGSAQPYGQVLRLT